MSMTRVDPWSRRGLLLALLGALGAAWLAGLFVVAAVVVPRLVQTGSAQTSDPPPGPRIEPQPIPQIAPRSPEVPVRGTPARPRTDAPAVDPDARLRPLYYWTLKVGDYGILSRSPSSPPQRIHYAFVKTVLDERTALLYVEGQDTGMPERVFVFELDTTGFVDNAPVPLDRFKHSWLVQGTKKYGATTYFHLVPYGLRK